MNICFITDNPETTRHPVIGVVLKHLSERHNLRLLDVQTLTGDEAVAKEEANPLADIYLLKSHTRQALKVARRLEERGAVVINSWASSFLCQDRLLMAQRMKGAGLPAPRTWSFLLSETAPGQHSFISTLTFPLMIKSRYSYRGDLIAKVHDAEELQTLARQREQGPFILQEFAQGDGSDIKLWVIDQQVFAARRPTPLEANASKETSPIPAGMLPGDWRSIAFEVGRAFGLSLYGVDLLTTKDGPIIVDVNSFPGFRGVAGAESALISLIERRSGPIS